MSQLRVLKLAISLLLIFLMIPRLNAQTSDPLLDGAISITASSVLNSPQCQPTGAKYSNMTNCWCSNDQDCNSAYLEVNLGGNYMITNVGVKACTTTPYEYITSYKIMYYNGVQWQWYNNQQILTGNNGCCGETLTYLNAFDATSIRMYPLTSVAWCSTHFEAYGYPWSPTLNPTKSPTQKPTPKPTPKPTKRPTSNPTKRPTPKPTPNPTKRPTTKNPTANPAPTSIQTPTSKPTSKPTVKPTSNPTKRPTPKPTPNPAAAPTTPRPTDKPTAAPVAPPP
eukprot:1136552_1